MKESEIAHKPLDKMNADERHYVIDYTDQVSASYSQNANQHYTEANATEQSLSNQLMLINTVILTASLIAISNGDLLTSITCAQEWLIVLIFTLQILSISSGIMGYISREKFFADAGDLLRKNAEISRGRKYSSLNEMSTQLAANDSRLKQQQGSKHPINLQIASILISLITFLVLILAIFFDMPGTYC